MGFPEQYSEQGTSKSRRNPCVRTVAWGLHHCLNLVVKHYYSKCVSCTSTYDVVRCGQVIKLPLLVCIPMIRFELGYEYRVGLWCSITHAQHHSRSTSLTLNITHAQHHSRSTSLTLNITHAQHHSRSTSLTRKQNKQNHSRSTVVVANDVVTAFSGLCLCV
jgi:hypothetical protein